MLVAELANRLWQGWASTAAACMSACLLRAPFSCRPARCKSRSGPPWPLDKSVPFTFLAGVLYLCPSTAADIGTLASADDRQRIYVL